MKLLPTLLPTLASCQMLVPEPPTQADAEAAVKMIEERMAKKALLKSRPLAELFKKTKLQVKETKGLCDDGLNKGTKQYSGYFHLVDAEGTDTAKKYFFWFFESRNNPSSDPTIMWLTGGPGCSSMMALMEENGPCNLDKDGTQVPNKYSWNSKANAFWIDQPPGTGFSTGTWDHDEAGVASDMYLFLQAFFQYKSESGKTFGELYNSESQKFFVTGESYAGHYIPAVSHKVWQNNKNVKAPFITINFGGFAIGNGLTAPEIQYDYYADMAYQQNQEDARFDWMQKTGPPAITSAIEYEVMRAASPMCLDYISKCQVEANMKIPKYGNCGYAFVFCQYSQLLPYQLTGMNPYNIKEKCEHLPLCYDFSQIATFFNREDVQEKLGVDKGTKWQECNMFVNKLFMIDWMMSFKEKVAEMLSDTEDPIRGLIYAGDIDFICNWMGNKAWVTDENFGQDKAWQLSAENDVPWNVAGKEAGKLRSRDNFAFLQVYQAGHMVPMDQPEAALEMLNQFLDGKIAPGEGAAAPTETEAREKEPEALEYTTIYV